MSDQHSEQHGSYYVPAYSGWPIIASIGLFCLALGSLNFDSSWGFTVFIIGAAILAVTLVFWFRTVIRESRQGLYDTQMDRTFRWGMFWFLFVVFCFFGTILGALIYVRWAVLPSLAG